MWAIIPFQKFDDDIVMSFNTMEASVLSLGILQPTFLKILKILS